MIEHILISPQHQSKNSISNDFYARNIIMHNGYINDFYLAEYFIVRKEAAGEFLHSFNPSAPLCHPISSFEAIKSSLREELLENIDEIIGIDEQLATAILSENSPSIIHKWHDIDNLDGLKEEEIINIYNKNAECQTFSFSFDQYITDKIPISKNTLRHDCREINIFHPWLSENTYQVMINVPLPENTNQVTHLLYRRSLTDYKFGVLYDLLRNKNGVIYDLSVVWNPANSSMEISFVASKQNYRKAIELVKINLDNYSKHLEDNLIYLKHRIKIEHELDWGDIQNQRFVILDEAITGGITLSSAERIEKLEKTSKDDLIDFHKYISENLEDGALYAASTYGEIPKIVRK